MQLEQIEITNYGSYYGVHNIDMEVTPKQPLVIVLGETGCGKTTIFDAINWGLYGEEYERDLKKNRERTIIDFANESAVNQSARTGKPLTVAVSITFKHHLIRYIKTQKLIITAKQGTSISIREDQRITSFKKVNAKGDLVDVNHEKLFLDEILPNNVKSYFLFDGDRISNLANPGNSQEVKDAIYRVVDLEIIKNAEKHLNDVSIEYARKAKREATGQLTEIEELYNDQLDQLNILKDEERQNKIELKAVSDKIVNIDSRLADLPESEKLQMQKQRLVEKISQKEIEELSVKRGMRSEFTLASYDFIREHVEDLHDEIDKKRKKGDIPKHVSETLINDILEIGKCICGNEITAKSKFRKTLLARLEGDKDKSEKEHEIIKLLYDLKGVQENITSAKQGINEGENRLITIDEQLEQLRRDLQEVENDLDKLPQEDVNLLRQNLKTFQKDKERYIRQDEEYKIRIQQVEENIKEYEKQRKQLSKEQKNVALLQRRGEVARKASSTLEELYDEFAEESRKAVEQLTIEEFKNFVLSSSGYKVGLSKEYELQVLDSNGNRALQRMSMGQSQCLSLAFITAISKVSQKNPPLVIDMPFGRLDHRTHAAISKRLPYLSDQTILFLIPKVEWYEGTKNILSSKAAHIYELGFNEKERKTHVQKIK